MMAALKKDNFLQLADLLTDQICDQEVSTLDCPVLGLSLDSRILNPGEVFLACLEQTIQSEQYIDQAIKKGAIAILQTVREGNAGQKIEYRTSADGRRVPLIGIVDLVKNIGSIADHFYGYPSRQMYVTGITGTNGKTSCCQYLAHALNQDTPCGVIGTLGLGLYGELKESGYTTPDALACHKALASMQDKGATNVVMEVSSHALDQARVNGIAFDCAVFTNLTREHLDYHGDMRSYGEAKRHLFTWPTLKAAVINFDDPFASQLQTVLSSNVKMLSYGLQSKHADLFAQVLEFDAHGLRLDISTPWGNRDLYAPLLGHFNASNLLAVLAVLLIRDIPLDIALERLAQMPALPGRMQYFSKQGQAIVVVDYAHTPDALKQALNALRAHCHGTLWCVFGCGGDRDSGKRAAMGNIAEQFADQIILTNDNPRHENPDVIVEHIQQGMSHPDTVSIIMNRDEAIISVISQANENDIVLIAGKGHETYQQIGDERRPFSDAIAVRNALGIANHAE